MTVEDVEAIEALRRFASLGLRAGESGAASLAGARRLLADPAQRAPVEIASDAVVLLLSTEGITDAAGYERVTARSRAGAPSPWTREVGSGATRSD